MGNLKPLWFLSELFFYFSLHQDITSVFLYITIVFDSRRPIPNVNLFADRLRHARLKRGISQSELARSCGLSQGAISNYEASSRKSPKNIFSLAAALRVNPEWLGTGQGPMELSPSDQDADFTYRLDRPGMPVLHNRIWPFPGIEPEDFWSLHAKDRQVIENTVISLMTSFRKKNGLS